MKTKYQIVNGTFYKSSTPRQVVEILERARKSGLRLQLDYGDAHSGRSWGETNDVEGRVGRSTGAVKIPLLVKRRDSTGGGAILDDCIVAISCANKKDGGVLYIHPDYQPAPVAA